MRQPSRPGSIKWAKFVHLRVRGRAVEEPALRAYFVERLSAAGAEVDVWEPSAEALQGRPLVSPGLDFIGRPQLVARLPGTGRPHIALQRTHRLVSAEPLEHWTSDPFAAEMRDGKLYGRGARDTKGGIAAMVLATEALARLGIELADDLLVATNTDEESPGAGGTTIVEHDRPRAAASGSRLR